MGFPAIALGAVALSQSPLSQFHRVLDSRAVYGALAQSAVPDEALLAVALVTRSGGQPVGVVHPIALNGAESGCRPEEVLSTVARVQTALDQ